MTRKHELRVSDYLEHILDAIQRIERYVEPIRDEREFISAFIVQDAVIRNLEVIGEAANNVREADADYVAQHPSIPWDLIYGMRNRIFHGYFDINLDVVWQTIKDDLPKLRAQIRALLDSPSARAAKPHL